jgi:hypothetical protein
MPLWLALIEPKNAYITQRKFSGDFQRLGPSLNPKTEPASGSHQWAAVVIIMGAIILKAAADSDVRLKLLGLYFRSPDVFRIVATGTTITLVMILGTITIFNFATLKRQLQVVHNLREARVDDAIESD